MKRGWGTVRPDRDRREKRFKITAGGIAELEETRPVWEQTTYTANKEYVMHDFRLLIDGRLVKGTSTLDVINPATGRTLTAAPRADLAQLDQAVAAVKTAWAPRSGPRTLTGRSGLRLGLTPARSG
jgi:hypothetical protein